MMREARIILPNADNHGADLTDCHCALRSTLGATWGGFTAFRADGYWRDGAAVMAEPVTVYIVAMPDTDSDRAKLESVAVFYGHMAAQACVYISHAAGDVVMVDCRAMVAA
jgi:hypothetical protein